MRTAGGGETEDDMRRTVMVGFGVAAAAVLAAAGAAAATGAGAEATTGGATTKAATAVATSNTGVAGTRITAAQARQAALAAVPGGTVTEVRLDTRAGVTVWNVHMRNGARTLEVFVDATTGRVIEAEVSGRDAGRDARVEPGDDRGDQLEPGDDHGMHAEPGDDHGVHAEPGDDHGVHAEPGDDHGGSGSH